MPYVCLVCGFVYDPALGDPSQGVAPGTAFLDLPAGWVCPVCGADLSLFEIKGEKAPAAASTAPISALEGAFIPLQQAAILSNLQKACDKQFLTEESALFAQLATFFEGLAGKEGAFSDLPGHIKTDLDHGIPAGFAAAREAGDRGASRALTWDEKVTKIQDSLLARYQKQGDAAFSNTNLYVCEACGFIFAGNQAPALCPVCKVPAFKFQEIRKGA